MSNCKTPASVNARSRESALCLMPLDVRQCERAPVVRLTASLGIQKHRCWHDGSAGHALSARLSFLRQSATDTPPGTATAPLWCGVLSDWP